MLNDSRYKQLEQIAKDNNYTVEQLQSLTKAQVADLLGLEPDAAFWSGGNEGFFINLKANLVQELEQRDDAAYKQALIAKVDAFLKEKFPNYEIKITRYDGRKVTIWLDGKPHSELVEV